MHSGADDCRLRFCPTSATYLRQPARVRTLRDDFSCLIIGPGTDWRNLFSCRDSAGSIHPSFCAPPEPESSQLYQLFRRFQNHECVPQISSRPKLQCRRTGLAVAPDCGCPAVRAGRPARRQSGVRQPDERRD
ncbi:hypothetical protein SDC9_168026 [bioreactor metagenome]|uniref:Uncharacterized protein n=1 Tax=bioreactor metagenome TaxID=1076179 RepID=A0A645G1D0_9ZZZZ